MFKVLGIETSCDDTGVAIVNSQGQILSNCLNSQLAIHVRNGGILPVIARDHHAKNIDSLTRQALEQAKLSIKQDVDVIAVTNRPGLRLSLNVGLSYAIQLAKKYSKPLIPIHHMRAHALTALMKHKSAIRYPFLGLLISGGHCLLTLVKRHDKFLLLGQSLDEAPGDSLDKIARKLKLKNFGPPYDRVSGGEAIEILSRLPGANPNKYFALGLNEVPLAQYRSCDFSFTSYRNNIDKIIIPRSQHMIASGSNEKEIIQELGHVCASLQRVMVNQIIKKIQRALIYCRQESQLNGNSNPSETIDLVISGGVACNQYFCDSIRTFCTKHWSPDMKVYVPDKSLCSDNGVMIAWNGVLEYEHYKSQQNTGDNVFVTNRLDEITVHTEEDIGEDCRQRVIDSDIKLEKLRKTEMVDDNSTKRID